MIATASKGNHTVLHELGADVAIDYRDANVADQIMGETRGRGVDASFDTAGGNVPVSTLVTRPFGRIATILPPDGPSTLVVANKGAGAGAAVFGGDGVGAVV